MSGVYAALAIFLSYSDILMAVLACSSSLLFSTAILLHSSSDSICAFAFIWTIAARITGRMPLVNDFIVMS